MTPQELDRRQQRSAAEPLVISRTEEGFRVYAPSDPTKSYIVSGSPEAPACTCPDFQYHEGDPDWVCKHILAVLDRTAKPASSEAYDEQERRAIREEARAGGAEPSANTSSQMLLKRSVSPDGRIDSLSVEFSCPVADASAGEIKNRAAKALKLQSEIVELFLGTNGGQQGNRAEPAGNGHNGAMPATLLNIAGLNTKWGRRLFVNVQVNGDTLKLFGTRKQLAECIAAAGFPDRCDRLDEGVALNLPCLVTTKPSDDGRYVNIDQVLPAPSRRPPGRGRL